MRNYFIFSNIMMTGLIALSVYGGFWAYFYEEKIMWAAIFTMLFAIRKIIKDNLKVGFSSFSAEVDQLTVGEKFIYYLQGGLSFSVYVSTFIIAVNKLLYDPSVIFLITLVIMTIIVDIYCFFSRKRNNLLIDN